MKRSTIFSTLMLIAIMSFAGTSAFAAAVFSSPTWTSPLETSSGGSAGQQINNVTISLTDNYYNIALTLDAKPVNATTYSVLLGTSADVLNNPTYYLDANAFRDRFKKLAVGFSAGSIESSLPFSASWDNNNKLTWLISKSDIFKGGNFWFAGQSTDSNSGAIFSETKATAVTPIPGAAWLLGSGILGLVVLRRRSKETK